MSNNLIPPAAAEINTEKSVNAGSVVPIKRGPGRPKGSKNRSKISGSALPTGAAAWAKWCKKRGYSNKSRGQATYSNRFYTEGGSVASRRLRLMEDGTVDGLPDGHSQPSEEEQKALCELFAEIRDQLWPKAVSVRLDPPPAGSYLNDPDVLKRTWHKYRSSEDRLDEVHFLVERIDFTPESGKPKRCFTWVYLEGRDRHGWCQEEPEGYSFPPYNLTYAPDLNATNSRCGR